MANVHLQEFVWHFSWAAEGVMKWHITYKYLLNIYKLIWSNGEENDTSFFNWPFLALPSCRWVVQTLPWQLRRSSSSDLEAEVPPDWNENNKRNVCNH